VIVDLRKTAAPEGRAEYPYPFGTALEQQSKKLSSLSGYSSQVKTPLTSRHSSVQNFNRTQRRSPRYPPPRLPVKCLPVSSASAHTNTSCWRCNFDFFFPSCQLSARRGCKGKQPHFASCPIGQLLTSPIPYQTLLLDSEVMLLTATAGWRWQINTVSPCLSNPLQCRRNCNVLLASVSGRAAWSSSATPSALEVYL